MGTPEAPGRIPSARRPRDGNLAVFDLSELVIGMREKLRSLLRNDIAFDISEASTQCCLVRSDRDQMRDLFVHLVLDAQDAMPCGGSLSIVIDTSRSDKARMSSNFEPAGDYVVVVVSDTQNGEDAEVPDPGDFRVVKGRGLSLAASYDAIKRSGGHISVSRRARETIVRIYQPRLASS
jgi:two-component system, cell cycle sensor histidine kinase and response regulator CckA